MKIEHSIALCQQLEAFGSLWSFDGYEISVFGVLRLTQHQSPVPTDYSWARLDCRYLRRSQKGDGPKWNAGHGALRSVVHIRCPLPLKREARTRMAHPDYGAKEWCLCVSLSVAALLRYSDAALRSRHPNEN